MTPQPANPQSHRQPHPPAHPDARINHVLEALRTTTPPTGIEERVAQRIAARVAQTAEARQAQATGTRQRSTPQPRPLITTDIAAESSIFTTILNAARSPKSLFTAILTAARSLLTIISTGARALPTVISTGARSAQWRDPRIPLAPARLYTAAATLTLLLTLTTITLLHHRNSTTSALTSAIRAQSGVPHLRDGIIVAKVGIARSATPIPSLEGAGLQSRRNIPTRNPALAAEGISHPASMPQQTPQPLSATEQPNPDTIALTETRAPSHLAPPMPLTAQEHLLLAAARPGQPIEVAELDIARAPFLRAAAKAQEKENIQRYVRTLLAPVAVANALSTNAQPQEISTPAPAPQPPSSLTN
jgi:hypothetical protein